MGAHVGTVREADRIYLLHRGRLAEQGTHAELMANGGHFAALWHAQVDGTDLAPAAAGGSARVGPGGNGSGPTSVEGARRA